MNNTGAKILIALEAVFDSQEKKAEAILFNYLNIRLIIQFSKIKYKKMRRKI